MGHHNSNTQYFQLLRQVAARRDNDCWIWPFGKNPQGYGTVGIPRERRSVLCHRLAFFLRSGHWPTPCGLHKCDNPACFNPDHIFEGTITDNNRDMCRKGRNSTHLPPPLSGGSHPNSKLTEVSVLAIRAEARTYSQRVLANKYGVDVSSINKIIHRKTWTHV